MKRITTIMLFMLASFSASAMSFQHAKEVYAKLMSNNGYTQPPPLEYNPTDEFNAYWNGSSITLDRGLLKVINSDDEMALVLGHEFGHYKLGHMASTIPNEYAADAYGYRMVKAGGFNACQARELFKKFPYQGPSDDHPIPMDRYNRLPC